MALKALPPRLQAEVQAALEQAARDPARRSQILGDTALGLVAQSQSPRHAKEAQVLRALAERIALAAMASSHQMDPATLDDFEETLEEHDAAHAQFVEDLDVRAHADDLHDAKIAQHGARVSIAPITWGKGATLGRTGRFKYGASSNDVKSNICQSATLAYWQGEPHEAQAITVDLAPPVDYVPTPLLELPALSPLPRVDTSSRPYGIVSYGSDGAVTRVKFDAGFGARLTVTGSYVSVVAGMDPPATRTLPGTMSLTCSIGAFASPSTAPVFVTEYIDQLDSDEYSAPIQRPMHATQLLPVLSDAVGGVALLQFWGQGAVRLLYQISYPVGQLLLPIPLPSEVQYVSVRNQTGDRANFRIIFQLSL